MHYETSFVPRRISNFKKYFLINDHLIKIEKYAPKIQAPEVCFFEENK